MKTLEQKKKAIFEFLDGKEFKVNDKRSSWILSLKLFDSSLVDCSGDVYMGLYDGPDNNSYGWIDGKVGGLPTIKFKEVQQFIQRTLLEDTYIEVKNEEESKWVQELFEKAGYSGKYGCGLVPTNVFARYRVGEYIMTWDSIERKPKDAYKISISYLETLFDTKFEPKEEDVSVEGHLRKRCDEYFDEIEKLKAEVKRLSIKNGLILARNLDLAEEWDKAIEKADGLQAEVKRLKSAARGAVSDLVVLLADSK